MTDTLRPIRDRRTQIARELAVLDEQVAVLRAEDTKLANAEEVFISFYGEPQDQKESSKRSSRKNPARAALRGKTPREKPADIPPMPEMILAALTDAHEKGAEGLEPKAIRDFIKDKWWPDVLLNAVGPIVWRMSKDDKLAKLGDLYALKKDAPVAVSPAEPAAVNTVSAPNPNPVPAPTAQTVPPAVPPVVAPTVVPVQPTPAPTTAATPPPPPPPVVAPTTTVQ